MLDGIDDDDDIEFQPEPAPAPPTERSETPSPPPAARKRRGVPDLEQETVTSLNYYQIMGLGDTGDGVSGKEIKAAYRRLILKYHPDKTRRGDQDIIFISIQKAYDTLRDDDKRRPYDSAMPFNEQIPGPLDGEGDTFYDTFGPVFRRNARFAAQHPVPDLGGEKATEEDVDEFYGYWLNFESWRDFSVRAAELAEMDPEDANSRDEKRWMQKEVQKQAKLLKKEEIRRVQDLVDRARAKDPRIRRFREEEKARREKAKADRRQARQRNEDAKMEAARLEEEETRRKEEVAREKAREAKLKREKMKKQLRKLRNAIRRALLAAQSEAAAQAGALSDEEGRTAAELAEMTEDALDLLIKTVGDEFGVDALESVLEQVQEDDDAVGAYESLLDLRAELEEQQRAEEEERREAREAAAAGRSEERERRRRVWTPAEMALLSKAIRKFPPGTGNRWETISTYMNGQAHTLWDGDAPANFMPFTKEECLAANQRVKLAVPGFTVATPLARPAPASNAEESEGGEGAGASQGSSGANGTASEAAPSSAESGAASNGAADEWSQEQQSQLEEGLKQFPASLDKNVRWKSIAGMVPGKTKKQCIQRYKEIKTALKAKRG